MGRLADLLLADDVNTTEEAELIRLLDAVQLATNEVGGLFGPTGQISNLSAGYLVIDSSGIHTAKNEVVLDRKGLTFPEQSSGISYLRWTNSAGTRTAYIAKATSGSLTIENQEGGQDIFILNKETPGDQIFLRIGMTGSSTLGTISIREDPGQTDRLQVDLGVGAEGTKFTIGGEIEIHGKSGGAIFIKERAASLDDTANMGQLWVKNDDPNILRYTDGDGTEFIVNMTAV